ncbi:hypothetical protein [Deinococcus arcticus]|uniref:Uncharacterized protein n=1 Tax=Deinococcus arcticus TaxID=2136176 RepID=A0A2T3W5U8_9DEIO|nr:hypothetical protein [Deinococcus arcticus]PTA67270.1 hypothetical protein C8263_13225 [Deinococcus arcticus]
MPNDDGTAPDWAGLTLYHRAVRDVRGDRLWPLNRLRDLHPEVYAREVAKYQGREGLLAERVERLDCLWNDVLFFSPVSPGPLLNALRDSGHAVPPMRFWTLPASALDPARACVRLVRPWPNGVKPPPDPSDELPFTPNVLRAVSVPPPDTLARLSQVSPGAPMILWMDVPHVLYRGDVPLDALSEARF